MRKPLLLPAIFVLALALRLPGWFTPDAKNQFQLFEPDEYQHVEIAVNLMKTWAPDLYPDWEVGSQIYNARGFGIHLGVLALSVNRLTGWTPDVGDLVLLGRILSTMYALLLIGLVYWITLHLFHSPLAALLGALLMALFDLNVSYSHYNVPEVAQAVWAYATAFFVIKFREHFGGKKPQSEPKWSLLLGIPLAAAGAFAVRFDFMPIALATAILLMLLYRRKLKLRAAVAYASGFVAFFLLSYFLITAFSFGWARVQHSLAVLYQVNSNVLVQDHHSWTNPVVFLFSTTAGTSMLVAVVFAIALVSLLSRGKAFPGQTSLRWWLLFLLLEFIVVWNMDIPFVRRASIFLPFVAIVAGRGLAGVLSGDPARPVWQRYGATALVILYTLTLTIISQSNTWFDTRQSARDYLNENLSGEPVHYSPYAWMPGMPEPVKADSARVLVLHETFYSRYWKSFTTPFQYPPQCCDEVYHCRSMEECLQYQRMLAGEDPSMELVKSFETREWMPERRLFKDLFGTYETFLGDVLIFRKK